jgi:hypothetical protein
MVHTGQDVAMNVCIIKEFNLFFLTLEELAKHIYVLSISYYVQNRPANLLIIFILKVKKVVDFIVFDKKREKVFPVQKIVVPLRAITTRGVYHRHNL